jgi:hypothetical protein
MSQSVSPLTNDQLDQLAIATIRTFSMDAVQQAIFVGPHLVAAAARTLLGRA